MTKLNDKKKYLKKGEKIRLCYDECFKIMFANPERLEPLTLLLSKVLEVSYSDIEGKISLYPLSIPNETIGEKKTERDIVVKFNDKDEGKIIIEVNFKNHFYETIINRNLNYLSEVASKGLHESDTYDDIEPTLLINFNTFYVDNIHKKIFDYYYFRNDEGYILTEKQKILNINIAKCYDDWYNKTYKQLTNDYEKDLFLLSAAMYTDKIVEYDKCIEELNASNKIKKIMEEVSSRMNEDEVLKIRYVDFLEENKKINQSIINDEKKKARKLGLQEGREEGLKQGIKEGIKEGIKQNQKEIIINMYKNNFDINTISKITNISLKEIKSYIDEN